MGRDDKIISGRGLEALQAAPGGVLEGQEGALGDEDHVEQAVGHHDVLGPVDDGAQDRGRRGGRVVAVGEHVLVGAGAPAYVWGVDGRLDVGPVEVDLGAFGQVLKGAGDCEQVRVCLY